MEEFLEVILLLRFAFGVIEQVSEEFPRLAIVELTISGIADFVPLLAIKSPAMIRYFPVNLGNFLA